MTLSEIEPLLDESRIDEWHFWDDSPIWAHEGEETTIEMNKPFSEERADGRYGEWARQQFDDVEVSLGNIRVKVRGIPYYEADILQITGLTYRAFFPLPTSVDRDRQTQLSSKNAKLGRMMTETASRKDFDEILQEGNMDIS